MTAVMTRSKVIQGIRFGECLVLGVAEKLSVLTVNHLRGSTARFLIYFHSLFSILVIRGDFRKFSDILVGIFINFKEIQNPSLLQISAPWIQWTCCKVLAPSWWPHESHTKNMVKKFASFISSVSSKQLPSRFSVCMRNNRKSKGAISGL